MKREEQKPTKGDFVWSKTGGVIFKPNPTGRWSIIAHTKDDSKDIEWVDIEAPYLKTQKLKVLSDLQHRILQQHGHGKIKTVEGMLRCISDQVFIMQSEICNES